jgi:photosystem II stability/assembly factor-like uncharacterized protein
MLKKFLTILFCFFLSGCGTFNLRVELAPAATATAQAPTQALQFPPTVQAPTIFPTATPNTLPYFSPNIRFSEGTGKPELRSFAPKTRQVFATWDYANMREGLTIRREWYLNGQLWLSREEPWDFAKYGANGTLTDVSIYDLDLGLPSGHYQLWLFINGQPQFAQGQASEQIAFAVQGDSASSPEPSQPVTLTFIRMTDSLRGWGIEQSGKVLRTTNGGALWQDRTPAWGSFNQHGFFALNSEAAWAVPGNDIIWRTQDGGQTWKSSQPIALPAEGNYRVLSLQFPDVLNGWVVFLPQNSSAEARMLLFKTADGGETWERVTELENPGLASYLPDTKTGMTFFDGQNGWIGGWWWQTNPSRWAALRTTNKGTSWQVEALPAIPNLLAEPPITCDGWAIADLQPGSMAVEVTCTQRKHTFHKLYYLSSTTGPEWKLWDLSGALIAVDFLDDRQGWMMTTGAPGHLNEIYKTVNGGTTWIKINQASWKTAQFDFVGEQSGWAIVGNGKTSALINTVDGGKTWQEIKPTVENR